MCGKITRNGLGSKEQGEESREEKGQTTPTRKNEQRTQRNGFGRRRTVTVGKPQSENPHRLNLGKKEKEKKRKEGVTYM